jgi:transketolase
MTVIVPADDVETKQATAAIADIPGPVYLRLGRYPVPTVMDADYEFEVGQLPRLRDGGDIVIFATGHMVSKSLEASELLDQEHIGARVVNVSTIKPMNGAAVLRETEGMRQAFSVEEHSVIGGLGGALAEVLAEGAKTRLVRLGVKDMFGESGVADELLQKHGLQPEGIRDNILKVLATAGR